MLARYIGIVLVSCMWGSCGSEPEKLFTDLKSGKTGIDFRNLLVEDESLNIGHYIYFYNGAGVAIGDINNDGLQDVFFTGNMVKNRLYLNKGGMKFENITTQSGVAEKQGWCTGATMVDINQDGFLDIYVCRSADDSPEKRKNLLFINNGKLGFTEEAEKYGLADKGYSTQATFFDYDKDGDLDCYVLNHSVSKYSVGVSENPELRKVKNPDYASRLYRNDNGQFKDVSDDAGIQSNVLSFGLGVALSDFNNDGWTDIYICNDFNESDYYYLNNRNGTFTDAFAECLDLSSLNSMGVDAADYNNDGLTDLVTLDMLAEDNYLQKTHAGKSNFDMANFLISKGFQPQYIRNMLQRNNGDGSFSEVGQFAGISNTDWSWSALLCDFDGDANKDLFVSNGFVKDFSDLDFINYSTDRLMKRNKSEGVEQLEEDIKKMPTIKIPNYIFGNTNNGSFENRTAEWGLDKPVISSGAAYADLDNDGDMDLVISNTNDYASVYENNARQLAGNNYLRVALQGTEKNKNGIGTKVKLYSKGKTFYQEQFPVRGYQSSIDMVLNFGLSNINMIDSLVAIWPNDRYQVLLNVPVNQTVTLKVADASGIYQYKVEDVDKYFDSVQLGNIKHTENQFNDFTVQTLLPNFLSRQGPCIAKSDVNKDGREDIFIGGSKGKPGQLFIQQRNGKFLLSAQPSIKADSAAEDVDALFFDANNDGHPDLYVGSGGYEFNEGDPLLQDRLYLNNGAGGFEKKEQALPEMFYSTGCVKDADIDGDGDLDLFVGGRVVPGKYPLAPPSAILINDGNGNFTERIKEIAPALTNVGMVTDALWVDVNKDNKKDLLVVGEWMPLKLYINKGGKLEDVSSTYMPAESFGWWNAIAADDFDGDGDADLVIGNNGSNTQYKASSKEPVTLHYNDFDGNGSIDPIFCYYIQGKSHPAASRDDLIEQMPALKKKFNDYASYAKATIKEVLSQEQLKDANMLKADLLKTVYLRNDGDAGFTIVELPAEAQFAPVHAIGVLDVNKDGKKDIVLAGNNTWTRAQFGRQKANHGTVFLGDGKGNFSYVPQYKSGLKLRGDVRSVEVMQTAQGEFVLFGRNDAELAVYQLK